MWPYPRVLAHRGGGLLAPENTIAALRCGFEHGFRAAEFDVMLAADSIPVLMHDERFGRTLAAPRSVPRSVPRTTAERLQKMDAGSWFGSEFAGEPVPLYAQAMQFCTDHGIWMNVEIKPAAQFQTLTGTIVARCTRAWFAGRQEQLPVLSSFSVKALLAARSEAPDIPRGLLVSRLPADWRQLMATVGAATLHIDHRALTPRLVSQVHAAGHGVFCYTVNSRERAAQLLGWGIDGFCTDRLDIIGPDFADQLPAVSLPKAAFPL